MSILDDLFSFFSPSNGDKKQNVEPSPEKQASLNKLDLTLYYTPTCPYCVRVLRYLEQEGLSLPMKDLFTSAPYRQELINIGGKGQVPCLVIDGKAMYESEDIIRWIEAQTKKS
ncbi:MAG: glutaredoxin 3 [Chlamydiales bacterium]|jgi:glutaredoxin 3